MSHKERDTHTHTHKHAHTYNQTTLNTPNTLIGKMAMSVHRQQTGATAIDVQKVWREIS